MPSILRKEATGVAFNTNTAWLFKMTLREVVDLFGRPTETRLDGVSGILNRPIAPAHRTAIEKYIAETDNWAFDTITLAAPKWSITQSSKIIQLDTDAISVLDGQHRLNAFLTLIQHLEQDAPSDRTNRFQNRINALLRDELPFLLYEVNGPEHQHELFTMFSKRREYDPTSPRQQPAMVREVELQQTTEAEDLLTEPDEDKQTEGRGLKTRMSLTGLKGLASSLTNPMGTQRAPDPFEQAAQAAIVESEVLQQRLGPRDTEGTPATNFLTAAHIKEIATTVQLGIVRTPNQEDRQACSQPDNQAALTRKVVEFFDNFLGACVPNYDLILDPEDFDNRIITSRSHSYAFEPQTIRLIANTWARWTIDYSLEPEKLAVHIGTMKMAKADPLNDIEASFALVHGQRKAFHPPKHTNWEKATAAIIEQALA